MKKQNIITYTAVFLAIFVIASCSKSKWDDYKKYTTEGETLYTGKIDSIKTYSGRLRVKLKGLLPADPKVTTAKVTWNDGKDSAIYSITGASGSNTIFDKIVNVEEGVINFKIRTFDAAGNGSMVVSAIGRAYGPKYEAGLTNRPIARAELLTNGNAELEWDSFDTTGGAKGTWVRYTKTDNSVDSVFVPITQALTTLNNFKGGTSVRLRTMYLPTPTVIDSFYAAPDLVGVSYDVTSLYIVDAGPNFACSAGCGNRWQTPANWITTADVRNGDPNIGGLDAGWWLPSSALSIESWWGMSPVPNGKVYQTLNLPAGDYSLVATMGDAYVQNGVKYVTVAPGNTLPDINNVPTQAYVYKEAAAWAELKLKFTVPTAGPVSVGIQANMPPEGNFMKLFKFRLYYTP